MKRRCISALMLSVGLLAVACSSRAGAPNHAAETAPSATTTARTREKAESLWVCSPLTEADVCRRGLGTVVTINRDLSRRTELSDDDQTGSPEAVRADCFYLYPTVHVGDRPATVTAADLGPEREAARVQAAAFSSLCDVWAPAYEQVNAVGEVSPEARELFDHAYRSVVRSWRRFLRVRRADRLVVLLADGQGARHAALLLQQEVAADPGIARLLTVAILSGDAGLAIPADTPDARVGGLPPCRARGASGCYVSWIAYEDSAPPPRDGGPFTREMPPQTETPCVNPAALEGGKSQFRKALFPTRSPQPGRWTVAGLPEVDADFVSYPEYFRGECVDGPGKLRYLRLDVTRDPYDRRPRPKLVDDAARAFGTGLVDRQFQVAIGDLLDLVEEALPG
ncbi:MAG: lysophospholipase [Acidimicrobiales bacterium]|nr:MAG: lysophospholipase [Acidimicrobiales bacterium]